MKSHEIESDNSKCDDEWSFVGRGEGEGDQNTQAPLHRRNDQNKQQNESFVIKIYSTSYTHLANIYKLADRGGAFSFTQPHSTSSRTVTPPGTTCREEEGPAPDANVIGLDSLTVTFVMSSSPPSSPPPSESPQQHLRGFGLECPPEEL